jgi:AcrR family transcriptional regulator
MADRPSTGSHKRAYHSPERQRQAEKTRRRILDAARTLFLSAGYAGTTVEAVATAAGVSPKTVAAVFGSKREILAALVSIPAFGRPFQEIRGQFLEVTEPRRRLELVAQLTRQAYETLTPELDLLRGAHAVAPELADLARQVGARRRQNLTYLMAFLQERGMLCEGLSEEEATDVAWALTSFDLYRALVVECGWEPDRYAAWLADVLIQRLLGPEEGSAKGR